MQTTVRIADVSPEATETATKTRAALAAWIDSIQDKLEEPPKAVVTKELKDEWKQAGASRWIRNYDNSARDSTIAFNRMLVAFNVCLSEFLSFEVDKAERLSYVLEGVCKEFSRCMHEQGMKWTPELEYLAYNALQSIMYGSGIERDWLVLQGLRTTRYGTWYVLQGWNEHYNYELRKVTDYGFRVQKEELRRYFSTVENLPVYTKWGGDQERMDLPTGPGVMMFRYTDTDGDWVAGFLSPKDLARCRFSRKRLGAFLTDCGEYTEEEVRSIVERAKMKTAAAQFVLYPNDTPFDDIYVMDGVQSCMAYSADGYESDGIHPTHVYSSSYMGCGDNGLALFTAQTPAGELIGRGIWNVSTRSIVRWYGERVPERTLLRLGVDTSNEQALKGSWLGLHKFGSRAVHPYVDGYLSYGSVDGNRIYIHSSCEDNYIELQDTSGSSYCNGTAWCEDVQDYHDKGECTYHDIEQVYTYSSDWRCPATGEWHEDRESIMLDGEYTEVSEYALLKGLIWPCDPTEDMVEEDMVCQDYDPDSDAEYKYGGDQNYTM